MTEPSSDMPIVQEQPQSGVRLIRLNRPQQLNALTREMVADLNNAFDAVARDEDCRVLILTGSGRAFCAGQDVKAADARNRTAPSGLVERMYWQEQFAGMAQRLRAMRQVVIAAVNGPAVGAGMAITLAADIRIGTRATRFLNAAVRLGLTAGETGMSYHLPRLIGAARAFEIMLTGRPIEAEEAERIGLITKLAEDGKLIDEALALAETLLAISPFALAHTKRILWENLEAPSFNAALELENRAQILASMTDDYKEATAAFTEKRKANFKGK